MLIIHIQRYTIVFCVFHFMLNGIVVVVVDICNKVVGEIFVGEGMSELIGHGRVDD